MLFRLGLTCTALLVLLPILTVDAANERRKHLRDSAKTKQRALSGDDYSHAYRATIQEAGLRKHLEAFQQAADLSGGIRAAGSSGWVKSVQYVARQLTDAGYTVRYHQFLAPYYEELTPPELTIVSSPMPITNTSPSNQKTTFFAYKGSASGEVQASVQSVAGACNSRDFDEMPAGSIALIQTGTDCPPYDQLYNAFNFAQASAVILVNGQQNQDALTMPFHKPLPIPVLLTSSALGNSIEAAIQQGDVKVRIATNTINEDRVNKNIIAETTTGNDARTIVVGAHLDSVFEGPGISDNGSGCAGVLELALQIKKNQYDAPNSMVRNKIRFAFWGAEENGKLGSTAYVTDLSEQEIADTACYMNLDMIGSKNFVRFVLDGDGSNSQYAPIPPNDSPMAHIEQTLHEYFSEEGLAIEEAPLSNSYGYTDHTAFFDAGIPVTNMGTGIGSPKTASQALIFGGEAGEDWDACYHQACDTIDNVNITLIKQMTRAAAHVLAIYGSEQGDLFVFDPDDAASLEYVPNNQQQLQTSANTPQGTDPPTLPRTDPPTPGPTTPELAKDPYWPGPFPGSTESININIMTDRFPEETQWEWSMRTGPTSWITLDEGVPSKSNTVNTQNQKVTPGELYRLSVWDAGGDGTCCSFGNGWLSITDAAASADFEQGTVVWAAEGDEFEDNMSYLEAFVWIHEDGSTQEAALVEGEGYVLVEAEQQVFVVPETSEASSVNRQSPGGRN